MTIGEKIINYISGIKRDIPRRVLAFFAFIFVGALTVAALIFDFICRFAVAFANEIKSYTAETAPQIKGFFVEYMRLW